MTNRLNNCEQANIDKIVETATRQIEDIEYLKENLAIESLVKTLLLRLNSFKIFCKNRDSSFSSIMNSK